MVGLTTAERNLRAFLKRCISKRIKELVVMDPENFKRLPPEFIAEAIKGKTFISGKRHGNFLFCGLDGGFYIVFYFGLHGGLSFSRVEREPKFARAAFILHKGECLFFVDRQPLFGTIGLVGSIHEFLTAKFLGPDALKINFKYFRRIFSVLRGKVKPILMDQMNLAGISSPIADEILFSAGINPEEKLELMDEPEIKILYSSMKNVLEDAIEAEHLPKDRFILPNRQRGGSCPRCKNQLSMTKIAGLQTYYCAVCQPVKAQG